MGSTLPNRGLICIETCDLEDDRIAIHSALNSRRVGIVARYIEDENRPIPVQEAYG